MKTILFVGLNDKITGLQEIPTAAARDLIANICFENSDGVTISECTGIYRHKDGRKIIEKSFRLEFYGLSQDSENKIIELLKTGLNQESIAVEKINSDLIFA